MLAKRYCFPIVACMCLVAAGQAQAGQMFSFSSDTGAGGVTSFDWVGGDQGTLHGAMTYAANRLGPFGGVDFRRNQVNMFLIDFSTDTSGRYSGAGLTLFVMWGNEREVDGSFVADVDVSPPMTEAADDGSYDGAAHIFALGGGVTIDDNGPVTVDVDVENKETPVGFAITNMERVQGFGQRGITNLQFTLAQAIRKVRLLSAGGQAVWQGVDDDDDEEIFTDGVVLMVPAPPALLWGIAGLAGMMGISHRRRG